MCWLMHNNSNTATLRTAVCFKSVPSAGKKALSIKFPCVFCFGSRGSQHFLNAGVPQFRKAKRSLANFNYVTSSGGVGSFAAFLKPVGSPLCWRDATPQPTSEDTKEALKYIPHCSFCCTSSNTSQHLGSHTAMVSMVSACPISALGYETTQQAHFLVSASLCRTNSSAAEK